MGGPYAVGWSAGSSEGSISGAGSSCFSARCQMAWSFGSLQRRSSMRRLAVVAITSFVVVLNEIPSIFPGNRRSIVSKIANPMPVLSMQPMDAGHDAGDAFRLVRGRHVRHYQNGPRPGDVAH